MVENPVLKAVSAAAGRAAGELTRRDIALALLRMPAEDAVTAVPELRRGLLAAGRPLSAPFWRSAEIMVSDIARGAATVGDVDRWLGATGSEPAPVLPDQLFLWPDPDEGGPVASEMHTRLVHHLESLVQAGTIVPDQLLVGDERALETYRDAQLEWLTTPLPDGREPMTAVMDEMDDAFLAEWDQADADARQILGELLADVPARPLPEAQLQAASARIREHACESVGVYALLREAGGVDPTSLPDDDRELWLQLAAGVVAVVGDPSEDVVDLSAQAAWQTLDHASWIGAVISLVRAGPGASADARTLAHDAATFDLEADGVDDDGEDVLDIFDDDEGSLRMGFLTVELLWHVLGAVDEDRRLTDLGWWGLPEALLRAWEPRNDDAL